MACSPPQSNAVAAQDSKYLAFMNIPPEKSTDAHYGVTARRRGHPLKRGQTEIAE
jgi:hypothetical protein